MTTFIDFNNLATGTVVDNEYKQDGVTISAIGGSNKAMIFDTANPTGGDHDLATNNLGKVLIISEDGDSHDPDDNAHGGTLRFVFDEPSEVKSLTFLDVEESAWVKFFDENGHHIKTIDVHGGVNNGQQVVDFNVEGVARMDVLLGGSGAIDNLEFVPASENLDFEPTSRDDLVSLWEFSENGEHVAKDTAGVTSNAQLKNGADMVGNELDLDGHNDYAVVHPAEEHQLSEGRLELVFNQDQHVGGSPDTLVSRDSKNFDDGGHFLLQVTAHGAVTVRHQTEAESVFFGTGNDFFEPGDDVRVSYSWDEGGAGGKFIVNNLTTGAMFEEDVPNTLTMDMGDRFNEPWTIGASQKFSDDNTANHLEEYFDGEISYFAIYDKTDVAPVQDGIVSNDNDGDLIDVTYDGDPEGDKIDNGDALLPGEAPQDDIVDANGGNDTIKSGQGDDDVYAGSGDDKVEGGAGDDLIFGDSNLPGGTPGGTVRESFEWDLAGAGDNQDLGGFTQDTGNVEVTFSILKETGHADTEFESDQQLVAGILDDGNGVDDNSSLYSVLNGHGNEADYRLAFSDPVENVSFRVNDIDGDGIVRIKAFDAAGNPITVNLTGGSHVTLSDTDGVAGNDTADSNGGYLDDTAPEYSLLVDIPGPVARIEIEHDQDGGNNTGINVTDVFFDAPVGIVDDGEDGNDMLDGGAGEDTIFGEGGDDMITGGDNDDSLDGGAGNDRIFGGAGNDTQIGGDGDDTLGGADGGDDVFDGGAGNDMVEASSGDDTIFGGSGNDDLWASHDDDFVDGGTGDDSINGGKGRDEIFGGEGDDAIQGGSDEDTIDGGTGNDSILGDGNFKDDNGVGAADEITGGAGNDTIDGGIGADTIDAGADADVIFGGAGDEIDGGAGGFNANPALNTDNDTLDLTGKGPFFVADRVADGNGNGFNGTIVFVDGAGVPTGETITFTEIENIVGDEVNQGPVAEDDTATVAEDGQVTINVLGNDSDPDGDALTITEATVPADQGTVEIVGGQLVFTPAPNFNGEATISYTVTDGEDTDTAEVKVDVTPVNDAPDAVDDTSTTNENEAIVIDLLANDTDVDGDDLTVTFVSVPANQGTVVNNGDGTATFTPAPGFVGTAMVSYDITDGNGGRDWAKHFVEVENVNDAPIAEDDTAAMDEDGAPITIDVLGNDSDPDGDTLTITEATVPADQGTVEIVGGQLVFTPAPNFNGDATISYTVSDGTLTDTAEVTVDVAPVNDAPDAVDDNDTTQEDTAIVIDLLANDTDVDGDDLTVTFVSVPANQGTVVNNGDGTATFTPAPDFNGTAMISYDIADGNGGRDWAKHFVEVQGVNDGPVAGDDAFSEGQDGPADDVEGNVLDNDNDADGDTLRVISVTNGTDTATVADAFGAPGQGMTVAGTAGGLVTINNGGNILFDPNGDFDALGEGETTTTTVSYTVSDGKGGTDTATVTITVVGANDDPVAVDDTADTDEDTAVVIDLIGNDTDVDGDDLTIGTVTVPADQGTVVDNGDGTVTFTPAPDFNGEATITYTVVDGNGGEDEGEAVVTVGAVNDGPVAVDDTATTDEDTPVVVDLLGNDTDADGDTLTIGTVTVPADQGTVVDNGDGTVTFTPAENFNGEATITYTVLDGNGGEDEGEAVVTVAAVNDAPIVCPDLYFVTEDEGPGDLDGNVITNPSDNNAGLDVDPDGDTLTIVAVNGDAAGVGTQVVGDAGGVFTLNADGSFDFSANGEFEFLAPGETQDTVIEYTAADGNGGTGTATLTITVQGINDAPDAVNDDVTMDEDTVITIDVLANDTDPEDDDLVVTGASVPAAQGTVEVVDNALVFTPAPDFFGEATISYAISDGNGGTDTAEVTVTVENVNDDPVAADDLAETDEDTPVVIDLIGNDTDVDGDPLTIGTVSVPADQGEVVDNGDGTVTFTPAPNFNGPATITYTVVDGQGGEDEGEATVNVGAVNDGPVAEDDTAETDEDTPVTIDVLGNDTDPDGDTLEITGATVPADQGTVDIVGDELVFTPAENFNGEATISYTISDGHGGTSAAEVTVTVNPVNDDPVAVDDIETTDEDTPVVVDLIGNDTDVDGDPLTIGTVTVPADQGTVVDNGDGTVTFTPAPDFNGPATITYTVVDGNGGEDEGEAVVSVGAVNDGPVANDDSDSTDEDIAVEIDLLANDTDADGDDLTVIDASVPADQGTLDDLGDGKFLFTPAPGFNGVATVSYTISDGNGGTDTAEHTIDVAGVNDAPVAVDDVVAASVVEGGDPVMIDALDNDSDPDGDPLEITEANVTTGAGDVAIVGNMIEFTPTTDFEGPVEITYTISDPDGLTDTAVITLNVQDGIVAGTDDGELINPGYTGDVGGDLVDSGDNIFSTDPEDADDDIIFAGGGNDTVEAGPGDDDVSGGAGDDQIHGGPGDDTIAGDAGEDTIAGGAGDDSIEGGADDDSIRGGDGSDTILGGDGNDSIVSSDPDNDLKIDKGYPGLFTGEEGTPEAENERDFVDGGAGDDTISTGDDRDTVIGGTGDDVIDGGIDDDEITGDEGNDRIVGGEGEDTIEGGIGNDTIFAGNDPVLGLDQLNIEDDGSNPFFGPDERPDNGRDLVFGGEGDDVIFGADDDDVLFGEDGNDFIDGEIDDDTIDGGIGDDTLLGGQGRDSIIGGEGDDSIDGGLNRDTIEGGIGDDTINGGNGKDELFGGDGDDVIDGGTGEDLIDGGAGEDDITGSTGNDTITGGAGNDTIDSGGGTDSMSGGDDRDLFINVNAGDVVDGNEGGDDFDVLDLTGSAEPGGSLNIIKDPLNEENGEVVYRDADGNITGTLTFTNIEDFIPCFTPGTLIATPTGERRVEDLKVGDRVITRDNGIQEVRWTGHRALDAAKLQAASHLNPILIRQGALGGGLPERDMMVSPQHRVLIASEKAALFFEEREVLVAAKHLVGMDGIDVVEATEVTYIHVMFDQHEVILSDGAWTESFQPGDQSMGSMDAEARAEIFELFPELATAEGIGAYTAARRTLKKHEAVLLTS